MRPQGIENGWEHVGKVISTEIGLGLLIITSAVETVAYSALAITSLTLYPVTDRPYKFFAQLLQSSAFTIIWGVADAILYNPLFINVMTQESFARYWAGIFNPTPIVIFRLHDRLYLADWQQQHRVGNIDDGLLGSILAEGSTTQELIKQGANFIQTDILASADADTVNSFKDMDSSMFMFILETAIEDGKVMQNFDLESLPTEGGTFPNGEGPLYRKGFWIKRLHQFAIFNCRF